MKIKKHHIWSLILLFLICVFIAFFSSGCKKKGGEANNSQLKKIEVAYPKVDSVIIYADYPAHLVSESQADIMARVNGKILTRHFREGSYVRQGDLLFTIEPTTYEASVRQSLAQLESARSQLEYASRHYEALKEAFAVDAVSQMEVEQAKSSKIQAEASVKSAKAALDVHKIMLGYCKVTAPVSGKISSALYDVGAYVAGEGSPVKLASVYDDNNLTINFTIPEIEYSRINSIDGGLNNEVYRNIPVIISSSPDANEPGNLYHASLIYSSPNVDSSTGSLMLKAKILDSADNLLTGMYGKVKLPINKVKDGILILDSSISTDQKGKYVYTLNDSNKIVYTPIVTGDLYNDSLRLVKSGISPKSVYVTRAMMNVRSGEKVQPVIVGK
ncbi:MAG: efflux RND transporter periplasmic adaptor subunit [Muribaculaceae bacterium]|nr:efflux RND transporter periplasmic adaptor subunit [Muribaculaceae bacterium]